MRLRLSRGLTACLSMCLFVYSSYAGAFGEIQISEVSVEQRAVDRYEIIGQVRNQSPEPREIILRAQLTLYDRTAPAGDKPVAVLRKDIQQVLKSGELRTVKVMLINEGATERASLRLAPMLRLRRNRVWNY